MKMNAKLSLIVSELDELLDRINDMEDELPQWADDIEDCYRKVSDAVYRLDCINDEL